MDWNILKSYAEEQKEMLQFLKQKDMTRLLR